MAGCSGEAPFVRTTLDKEPRVKTLASAEFNPDPSDMQKQKAISFYQTPKPPAPTRATVGSPPPPALAKGSGEAVASINLDSMPLPQFVTAVFNGILKLNVSMDPQVAQRTDMVSLRTGKPQTEDQIFSAAQMVLRSYGLAVREFNGLVRVTPENSQTGTLPEIRRGRAMPDVPEGLRPIFYLAELENTNVTQAVNWIRTLFPGRITATEDQTRNSIMLSGQTDAVKAALEALQLLDQPLMRGRLSARIVPVFWSADEMARRLIEMLNAEGYAASQSAMTPAPILVLPIAPVNSVIVFASSQNVLDHTLRWAQELDQAPPGRGGGYITYHVRNTDASDLATTLKEVMGESVATAAAAPVTTPSAAGATGTASASAATPIARSSGSRVVVNKQGNSLIIKTTPSEYQQWYGLLQELDRPSRTALIMATVAEVYLDESEAFGFTWMVKQFQTHGYQVNTGTSASPGTTSSVAEKTFRIAVAGSAGDPRALLTALASNNKTKLLANPSVMARNGETATIQVGQEVPITTSTISTAASGIAGTTTQNTVQYRSTGVILKVKPVIHSGGRVEIDVSQEVSSADTNTTSGISSPVISTRKVDTKLSVSEGNTILLGGLLRSDTSKNIGGIPYLKDIPYVGALFRTSHTESEKRTELIVMLTPYIVEDDFDARSVTEAFRNQFSWAKEAVPLKTRIADGKSPADKKTADDAQASGQSAAAPSPVLPVQERAVSRSVADPAVEASQADKNGKGDEGANNDAWISRGQKKTDTGTPSVYRSKPYVLPEKEDAPAVYESSVVPAQQNPDLLPRRGASPDANQKEGMVDSQSVQDLPKQAGEARPVTNEALRRELLEAVKGASSGGGK